MDRVSINSRIAGMTPNQKVIAALQVLVLTPHIRGYLERSDPKALQQAREALRDAGVNP
jgi:hypothetical protein